MSNLPKTRREAAEALRRTIRGIEEAGSPDEPRLPLGVSEIDHTLPGGGLRLGCIHEVAGDEAATGFCAALLARALAARGSAGAPTPSAGTRAAVASPRGGTRRGALLWLARDDDLYAPGLVRFGIEAGQLLVVSGLRRQDDMLWAMEEALRCRAVRGVVAETGGVAGGGRDRPGGGAAPDAGRRGDGGAGAGAVAPGWGAAAGWGGGAGGRQPLAGDGRPGGGGGGGRRFPGPDAR